MNLGQAYWLAIVLLLKKSGVRTPLAARIADYVRESVRTVAHNLGWDWPFDPFAGALETQHKWGIEIGDMRCLRITTTASPSHGGRLFRFPWADIKTKKEIKNPMPTVILSIDLARLAQLLRD
jgi:hypothetical protein